MTTLIGPGTALIVIDVQECGRQPYDEAGIAMMTGYDERVEPHQRPRRRVPRGPTCR